jgi:hypothetical protein
VVGERADFRPYVDVQQPTLNGSITTQVLEPRFSEAVGTVGQAVVHVGDFFIGDIVRAVPASVAALNDIWGSLEQGNWAEAARKATQYRLAIVGGVLDSVTRMTGVQLLAELAGGNVSVTREMMAWGLIDSRTATTGGQIGAGGFQLAMMILPVRAARLPRGGALARSGAITIGEEGIAAEGRVYRSLDEAIQATRVSNAPRSALEIQAEGYGLAAEGGPDVVPPASERTPLPPAPQRIVRNPWGRNGTPAHQADVLANNQANGLRPMAVGDTVPDGVGTRGQVVTIRGQQIDPGSNGRVLVESDRTVYGGRFPESQARGQIRSMRAADPQATIVVTDPDNPALAPLIYPSGTQPPPTGSISSTGPTHVTYP